jgi:hypothetical protein
VRATLIHVFSNGLSIRLLSRSKQDLQKRSGNGCVDLVEFESDQMLSIKKSKCLGATFVLLTCLVQFECFAQTDMSNLCFDIATPANAGSVQVLDADDNPYIDEVIGNLTFEIQYRQNPGDPFTTAGSVDYLMESDGAGFLIDNSGQYCTDIGVIPDVSEIQISMNVNAGEWQAAGLDPWALDNISLFKNNSDLLFTWDYEVDTNASQIDPLISSSGGFGDAWSGDFESSAINGGALEFIFPNGGGGGSAHIYSVAAVPEPNSLAVFSVLFGFTCLIRRR